MGAPPGRGERQSLAYYEAVPYLVVLESVERGGEWLRRAEHPELPGCVAEAPSALEALDQLEQARLRVLAERPRQGGLPCWHAMTTSE